MVSSGGFCYTEVSATSNNNNQSQTLQNQFTASHQIQDFHRDHDHDHDHDDQDHDHQPNNDNNPDQIFMDNNMWKGFNNNNNKPQNHHHDQFSETTTGDLIVGPDHNQPWQNNNNNNNNMRAFMVDESALRSVFPCENERPIQGLSLTLSSNNPSSIGLQSFELRQTTSQIHQPSNLSLLQQQTQNHHLIQLRNSKFLSPTQELLNEFCSLGTNNLSDSHNKLKSHKSKLQWELDLQDNINNNNNDGASSSKKHSLYSLEFMELQKRKTKLLSMLEEVERRYKKYCEQMRAVVTSFEAVAGPGAAAVYSALASKAMSRHFRCLKDSIANQIEATRKAMGEKAEVGPGVPGTTRGETPRLRILDQTMRQQRAFQQMSLMESHPWRPQRGLPERSVSVLRAWLFEHFLHPYPSDVDKHILARQTGLSRSQVSNWFINARVRLWKPMVEEMYVEETKEVEILDSTNMAGSSSDAVDILAADPTAGRGARPDHHHHHHDQKPTADQLVRIDSECLSSIVNNPPDKNDTLIMRNSKTLAQSQTTHHDLQRQQNFSRFPDHHSYNAMELDFPSYPYPNDPNQGFIGGGGGGTGGVSLTLGLQQHHHHHHHHQGVSLAFSPGSQSSMFYPRSSSDHHHHHHGNSSIDDQVPAVQYSLLDGDQGQNLPYRNLMGAQLLHDLA